MIVPIGVAFSLLLILIPVAVILCSCHLGKRADEEDTQAAREQHARELRAEFDRDRQRRMTTMGDHAH